MHFDICRDRTTDTSREILVNGKIMYVAIVFPLINVYRDFYRDINDGSYFRNHSLFSQQEHALQTQFYYDDFDTAKPLGSKKEVHKRGCICFIQDICHQSIIVCKTEHSSSSSVSYRGLIEIWVRFYSKATC